MKKKRLISRSSQARILLAAGVIAIVALIIGGIVLAKSLLSGPKSLTLTPDFSEAELDVNKDYTFTITTDPANAKLSSLEYVADNASVIFTISDDGNNKAVLHTTGEGDVTLSVIKGKIESNTLTYTIVDQAAKAQAEAEEAARAQAEADAAAEAAELETIESETDTNTGELVMTTDVVKIRKTPGTDGDVLEICKKYDSFTRYDETEDGWSRIDYNGSDAYIKSEFLKVATQEEITQAKEAEKAEEEKAKEEKAKADEAAKAEADEAAKAQADAAAKAEADAAAKAQADAAAKAQADAAAKAQADAAAKAQADATPAAPAVETPAPAQAPAPAPAGGTVSYTDKNGATTTFTAAEWSYIMSYWEYTGQAEYFVHKHTCAELHALYDATH